jgi:hypothetical protein
MTDAVTLSLFPNPVTGTLNITYRLTEPAQVSLSVFNIVGQKISDVLFQQAQTSGEYHSSTLLEVPGVYLIRFTVGNFSITRLVTKI